MKRWGTWCNGVSTCNNGVLFFSFLRFLAYVTPISPIAVVCCFRKHVSRTRYLPAPMLHIHAPMLAMHGQHAHRPTHKTTGSTHKNTQCQKHTDDSTHTSRKRDFVHTPRNMINRAKTATSTTPSGGDGCHGGMSRKTRPHWHGQHGAVPNMMCTNVVL